MILFSAYKPNDLPQSVLTKIIELEKSIFDINDETIINYLADKDILHVYTDTHKNKVVGLLSFKWVIIDNCVCFYIGTVVIAEGYQNKGILSKSLLKAVTKTYLQYPLLKKYALAFSTTPQAYQYFTYLKEYWPRSDCDTPTDVIAFKKKYMEFIGVENYMINKGAIINMSLVGQIYEKKPILLKKEKLNHYFYSLVGQENDGAQLFCLTPFHLGNYWMLCKRAIIKKLSLKSNKNS